MFPMSLPEGFTLRPASSADLDTLVAHRQAMFHDMGYRDNSTLNSMSAKFRTWLLRHMDSGDYHAWLVCAPDASIAAGAGLWLMDWPPHMIGQSQQRANLLNVYAEEPFRRRGLAREVQGRLEVVEES